MTRKSSSRGTEDRPHRERGLLAPGTIRQPTVALAQSPVPLVIALAFGVFFAGLDQTFVVTILPDMMPDLGITVDNFGRAAWIVNGYLLGYTVAMPLMGRVADTFGHLRIYVVSTLLFLAGSAMVALAPNLELLAAARAVQAIGGGAIVPISMAIAGSRLLPGRRALAIGLIAALDDASSLLGPLYAAALVEPLGWRGLFWLNIPLQIPWLLAVALLVRRTPALARHQVDWIGGLLLATGLACLTIGLTNETDGAGSAWVTALWMTLALASTAAFVARQRRAADPLIPVRSLRQRVVGSGMALYFIDGAATITIMICIPLMTNVLWGGDPLQGGLNLMKMMVWMPVGGILGGWTAQRLGYRPTAALSFLLLALAYLSMYRWPDSPGPAMLWGTLLIAGLGIGLNDAPILGSVLDNVRAAERATAAALTQMVQTTGMIVGTALLATQGIGRFDQRAAELFRQRGLSASPEEYQAILRATFDEIFLVAAFVTLLGAGLALLLARGHPRQPSWSPVTVVTGSDER
jgi:MFS family permease